MRIYKSINMQCQIGTLNTSLIICLVFCENPYKMDLFPQDFALQAVFCKHFPNLELVIWGTENYLSLYVIF